MVKNKTNNLCFSSDEELETLFLEAQLKEAIKKQNDAYIRRCLTERNRREVDNLTL